MKKILVIIGHPGQGRMAHALADEYMRGAKEAGAEVKSYALGQLHFDPILHDGYAKIQELEPDLKQVQQDILWADHIVTVYPIWWGTFPSILKGFFDRVFLPRVFYRFEAGHSSPLKLLKGKTARAIVTCDAGNFFARLGMVFLHFLHVNYAIWGFVGVKPFRVTTCGPVVKSTDVQRKQWLQKVYNLGLKLK